MFDLFFLYLIEQINEFIVYYLEISIQEKNELISLFYTWIV